MIIIKLQGGLGNQMFQYALGRNLSLIHNTPFKIDLSYFEGQNQSGRTLRIDGFKTILSEATPKEINAYCSPLQKLLDKIRPESKRRRVVETEVSFNPQILKRAHAYFVGHWNNEGYFKASEQTLRKDFEMKKRFGSPAKKIAEQIASKPESVSVHIRRGDYVSIPKIAAVHRTLPLSYYEKAIKIILEKAPNAHFFISSDDINWARENFPKNYPTTFISSPEISDYEELMLMSLCKRHIIANSTFSWWGAWLNLNSEQIVVAPKEWFVDPKRAVKDLIPTSWIQI